MDLLIGNGYTNGWLYDRVNQLNRLFNEGNRAATEAHLVPRSDVVEHGESLGVIGPILTVLVLVQTARSPEQSRAIHQPERQSRVGRPCPNQAREAKTQVILELNLDGFIRCGLERAWVARHHQLHVDALC